MYPFIPKFCFSHQSLENQAAVHVKLVFYIWHQHCKMTRMFPALKHTSKMYKMWVNIQQCFATYGKYILKSFNQTNNWITSVSTGLWFVRESTSDGQTPASADFTHIDGDAQLPSKRCPVDAMSSSCPSLCLLQVAASLQGQRAYGSESQASAGGSLWEWTPQWRLGETQRQLGRRVTSPPRRKSLQYEACGKKASWEEM